MNSQDFWNDIASIIAEDFSDEGLAKLESYAEHFFTRRLVYKRFSPSEQHGCSTGGATHVIASILAGAEVATNRGNTQSFDSFKAEIECGTTQENVIERWAKINNCWIDDVDVFLANSLGREIAEGGEAKVFDHGATLIKSIGLDYFIQPILALDRITLHNTYFSETRLMVIGFGRDSNKRFKIVVEQPFVEGNHLSDNEIADFAQKLGFKLINQKNWTFATPEIYLSDLHDENVICSKEGNIFVVDCDIRINTPDLRCGGIRTLTTEVEFK